MEKRKYVISAEMNYETVERVVIMTQEQREAIDWFIRNFDIEGSVDLIENYAGEEI